jgi:hypothetical protein
LNSNFASVRFLSLPPARKFASAAEGHCSGLETN